LSASRVAVAEMDDGRHRDALEAAVERARTVVEDLLVPAGHRRLVELEHVAAGGLEVAQLGIDRGGDDHRKLGPVLVGLVERAIDPGHRPGKRHLHRAVGVRLGEAEVVDGCRTAASDLASDAWHHARLMAAAIHVLLRLVDEVDTVPRPRHVEDEAFAALLAIGQEIEADLLLLAQRYDRGIVLRLAQLIALEPEGDAVALGMGEPYRAREASNAGGRDRSEFHPKVAPPKRLHFLYRPSI